MGPGKARLLEQLQKTGSIAEAAERMGMSYMRAWKLIKTMERCFKQPLVEVKRGGAKGGGAELTKAGKEVLELYQRMEAESLRASRAAWHRMLKLLVR